MALHSLIPWDSLFMSPRRNKLGVVYSMAFIRPMIRVYQMSVLKSGFYFRVELFVLSSTRRAWVLKYRLLTLNACLFLSQVVFVAQL